VEDLFETVATLGITIAAVVLVWRLVRRWHRRNGDDYEPW
jgi:hypothetical protein